MVLTHPGNEKTTVENICPCCGTNVMCVTKSEYNVDNFGSVLMKTTTCQKCGYKHTDILSLEKNEPTIFRAKISSASDLEIRVVKSGTATIKIPEFGATITPGQASEGFITNVEGVLDRLEDTLTFMLSSADEKHLKKGRRILKLIQKSKGNPCFTFIIEDPFGNSRLISSDSSKIKTRNLTNRELQKVKFGLDAVRD